MINEEFDDEGVAEYGEEQVHEAVVVQEEPDRPVGAWKRDILGQEIWFRPVSRAQAAGLRRFYKVTLDEIDAATDDWEAVLISQEFYDLVHDLIDTLFVDPADRKVMNRALIQGVIDQSDLLRIVFQGTDSDKPEPDDDAEPVSKPKPSRAASPARAKKAANAKRTQR